MGSTSRESHTHIDITHIAAPRSPSQGSQDDELHGTGVQVSAGVSPQYSVIQPTQSQSQSGSSSHQNDFVHLGYPADFVEGDGSDSASRVDHHDRIQRYDARSNSGRRELPRRQESLRAPARSRTRDLQESPTESGDSTEEFLRRDLDSRMPRPQSYYGHNGYTVHSSSSGSYPYPPVPHHASQVVAVQPQPMAMPYPPHYPPGQPVPYPPHGAYPGGFSHHAGSQVSAPYSSPPYGPPTIVNYGGPPPPGSYFPGQYPAPFAPQQYPPHYMQYAQQMPSQMPYPYPYPPIASSPQPPASASASAEKLEPKSEEDILRRLQALMKEEQAVKDANAAEKAAEKASLAASLAEQEASFREQALRQAEEKARQDALRAEEEKRIREQALIQAADKARAEAAAAAARAEDERRIREDAIRAAEEKARAAAAAEMERRAQEQRIREEARQEAIRAYEEQVRKAAEQAAREQQIRKEAAEAALAAAAADAAAKAEKAAAEKKIADDAAAAAKTAAEQESAAAAAAAKEEAKKAQEEAEAKLKEAETAAATAKAEAEEAEKKAAAAAPPERRAPVRFKDAIGRSYNFPWERCCRWRDMEGLINQAFQHIDNLADHVMAGRYDLIGPDKEIIMPNYWESIVEPDMHITMMMWPIPEPPPPEEDIIITPGDDGGILIMDDGIGPRREKKGKKKKPTGLAGWMLGGQSSRGSRSLKGDKKPDVAAKSQHGATEQGACIVM
ncbi:hypothetical protein H2200_013117 [Cladophialophora chaetospira]|uniref:Ubiquitin-like domain-containing protein n=1 Tax=Cladophialophora chaetospira TaxID=386627 RepID=A0AA38WW78_9EURO|nr:hypothetical protein H2200_013117 [Cladophialophora chaetospira]